MLAGYAQAVETVFSELPVAEAMVRCPTDGRTAAAHRARTTLEGSFTNLVAAGNENFTTTASRQLQ